MKNKLKEFIQNKIRKILREQLINEGVFDPNILKAIFMAGGPGSGKSFIANNIFQVDKIMRSTSPLGLKMLNSDPIYEKFLKKAGINPSDLIKLSKAEFDKITKGKESPRQRAKSVTIKQFELFRNARLGLVIDGTGKDITKIKRQKKELEVLGYDTYMIFVDTSLKVALDRNAERSRQLPSGLVKDMWTQTSDNKNNLKSLFGSQFSLFNNDKNIPVAGINKEINKFLDKSVKNTKGQAWIEAERKIKNLLVKA